MAKPATVLGTQLFVKVGNGADPEVFTHPCLINTDRGITLTANGNKVEVPDCDSPDDPVWVEFVKQTLEGAASGAGVIDTASIGAYTAWLASKDSKNVQVWLGTVGYWAGAFHLTKMEVTGKRGDKAQGTFGFDADGDVAWVDA